MSQFQLTQTEGLVITLQSVVSPVSVEGRAQGCACVLQRRGAAEDGDYFSKKKNQGHRGSRKSSTAARAKQAQKWSGPTC